MDGVFAFMAISFVTLAIVVLFALMLNVDAEIKAKESQRQRRLEKK